MLIISRISVKLNGSLSNTSRFSSSKPINIKNKFRFAQQDNESEVNKSEPRLKEENARVRVKKRTNFESFETDDLLKVADEHRAQAERLFQNKDKVLIKPTKKDGELKFLKRSLKAQYQGSICENGEILFGVHPVLIALQQKRREFYKLYLKSTHISDKNRTEIETLGNKHNIPLEYVEVQALDMLSGKRLHQGVCADVSKIKPKLFETNASVNQNTVWLLLCNIQDPMNLGAILRTSYFFGVEHILCTQSCCPLSPVVSKASSGALELLEISLVHDISQFMQDFKNEGWSLIGTFSNEHTETTNPPALNINDYNLKKPAVILMGSEGEGLSSEILNMCDVIVNIKPGKELNPAMNSLNVSAAASIILQRLLSSNK